MKFTEKKYFNNILKILFLPLSLAYYIIISVRHFLYDNRIFRSYEPDVFTVSIGNITVGGTGKSPTVVNLVKGFSDKNINSLVISRGYGRKTKGRLRVNDNSIASQTGDEPLMIYKETSQTVICDADRTAAIKDLGKDHDIIILDDAFQHRQVNKQLDIVLIDEKRFLGNKLVLPSGILRDSVSRLHHADIILLSKVKDIYASCIRKKLNYLKRFKKEIYISVLKNNSVSDGNKTKSFESLKNNSISVFCGLGDPDTFFDTFKDLNIINYQTFPDHFEYPADATEKFLERISKDSDLIITTQKDFVKISQELIERFNILYLNMELEIYDRDLKSVNLSEMIIKRAGIG